VAPRVDLKKGELAKHVTRAVKSIRDGYVIVAPAEHGYIYLTDAFSPFAVRAMHVLRGDEDGVAAQVFGHSAQTIQGIARDIPAEATALMEEFWPGLLSITLKPNRSLNWDLGDNNSLDRINVRVPKSRFLKALLKESGPLAISSASPAGSEPMLSIDRTAAKDWDVAVIFDNGVLKPAQRSTVVDASISPISVTRAGAISVAEMTPVAPGISAS
jgi:tRNA threonylcarbamoyl adenosine modification protein (Sua5/YciO/YrdC/YwlC family)